MCSWEGRGGRALAQSAAGRLVGRGSYRSLVGKGASRMELPVVEKQKLVEIMPVLVQILRAAGGTRTLG
eukprot:7083663-Pyramimonas_sp.AAC.1